MTLPLFWLEPVANLLDEVPRFPPAAAVWLVPVPELRKAAGLLCVPVPVPEDPKEIEEALLLFTRVAGAGAGSLWGKI